MAESEGIEPCTFITCARFSRPVTHLECRSQWHVAEVSISALPGLESSMAAGPRRMVEDEGNAPSRACLQGMPPAFWIPLWWCRSRGHRSRRVLLSRPSSR